MTPRIFVAAFATAALWTSPVARAATVEITAYGTITSTSATVPAYWTDYVSPFVLGDQVTATLLYESNTPLRLVPTTLPAVGYWPANALITTSSGWSTDQWAWFTVGPSDITFNGQSGDPRGTFPLLHFSTTLFFSDPFARIPPSEIDISAFLGGTMNVFLATTPYLDTSFNARFDRITALTTPVPGAAGLFVAALAGLAGLARRRKPAADPSVVARLREGTCSQFIRLEASRAWPARATSR